MNRALSVVLVLFIFLAAPIGRAAAPPFLPVQGILTDADGQLVEGAVDITFSIYADQTGGTALWFETQDLVVEAGVLTSYLGSVNQLPLELFRNNGTLYLGIQVETDDEMPRIRLGSIPYSAFAEYTGTQTLEDLSCAAGQLPKWDGSSWVCAQDQDEDQDLLSGLSCAEGQVAKRIAGQWTCAEDLDGDLLSGLSCQEGQVIKHVGGQWTCAEDQDQDLLSGLNCTEGQVAKRIGGQWACADDLSITEVSDEYLLSAGPANCTSGCTTNQDLGNWTFCALTRYKGKVYDNGIDHNNDVWRCRLTKDASNQWQLTAFYNANGNTEAVGDTVCGAHCFR